MDFLCDLCGVAKITKFDLKEHQRRAHDERNFNCPECNATFVGQNKLQSHLQTHRRRTCSDCGLEITKKNHKCKTKGSMDLEIDVLFPIPVLYVVLLGPRNDALKNIKEEVNIDDFLTKHQNRYLEWSYDDSV